MTRVLRRTPPFLYRNNGPSEVSFVVDRAHFRRAPKPDSAAVVRIRQSLDLAGVGSHVPADLAEELISEQYDACLDYMFAHPFWAELRNGQGDAALRGFLLETRHYLQAAASRMAPGVAGSPDDDGLTALLTEHVVEEADHARFFEEALAVLDADGALVARCRPSPVTLEWIFLMRAQARRDPMTAVLCSGLMESSGADKQTVLAWHQMLFEQGLLPPAAVTAMLKHVELDMALGHGSNWRRALQLGSGVSTGHLVRALNSISIVAEMIDRWTQSLQSGATGYVAGLLPWIREGSSPPTVRADPYFEGLPVWPAEVLHQVVCIDDGGPALRQIVGLAYCFAGSVEGSEPDVQEIVRQANRLSSLTRSNEVRSVRRLEETVDGWLGAINGHRLWVEMTEQPSLALVYGWLLENYHYLAAGQRHVCNAISACTDPAIRRALVVHLEEERAHCDLLARGLRQIPIVPDLHSCRPLPTTVAFIGFLIELGSMDWRAYLIVLGFLQRSLRPGDGRHKEFYDAVARGLPEAEPLLRAMREHDQLDTELGHDTAAAAVLCALDERHRITSETLSRAAMAPQLAWSFLDGIRSHYRLGTMAVVQRLGWTVGNQS